MKLKTLLLLSLVGSCSAPALAITIGPVSTTTGTAVATASLSPLTVGWTKVSAIAANTFGPLSQTPLGTLTVSGFDANVKGLSVSSVDGSKPSNWWITPFKNGQATIMAGFGEVKINGTAPSVPAWPGVSLITVSENDTVSIPVISSNVATSPTPGTYQATYTVFQELN